MFRWLFPKIKWSEEEHIVIRQQENRRLTRELCEILSFRWILIFFLAFTYNTLCLQEHWHGYIVSFAIYFLFGAAAFGTFVFGLLVEKLVD